MEERVGDEPEDQKARARRLRAESRARVADALGRLKALDARWAAEGDSEALWQEEHAVLLVLSGELELRPVLKRAKAMRRVGSGRPTPKDLAEGALGLWALDRLDEAAEALRLAVERLPDNRYPWDLLLRHASMRGADEGIAFINSSLPRIAWRGYALTQLGARHLDAASKALTGRDTEGCRAHLAEARKALEGARGERDLTDEMRANGDRLLVLVERLERRLAEGQKATSSRALERIFGQVPGEQRKLEGQVRTVAEAAGVNLEGESDPTLDLDEVERLALKEQSPQDRESTVTVIRVTPVKRSSADAKKDKAGAPPQDRIEEA